MEHSQRIGLLGEVYAARFLRDAGYGILAANYASKSGEIDIVAEQNGVCVFVEVKSRDRTTLFAPADAVDAQKQERVRGTAAAFLAAEKTHGTEKLRTAIRFDIIEVLFSGKDYTINHVKNAF
ncbi:MAG: YraN family protein [Oscillospiraceae bacterium]|jgi:uncharacterized protein (TIGR00252 family)|nr:YraN family protein [Oscillospiraceae bacterium]